MKYDYAPRKYKKQRPTQNEMVFIFILLVLVAIIIAGLVFSDTKICTDVIGGKCV